VDESTDVTNDVRLLCFVRYVLEHRTHEEFLFCKTLPTHCTGQAISEVLSDYMTSKKRDWKKCLGMTSDGARAMTGKLKGLTALVKSIASLVVCNHWMD
jgi:hypothetical protein